MPLFGGAVCYGIIYTEYGTHMLEDAMADETDTGVVDDHDSLRHQMELQLGAHPEVNEEEDLLLLEYHETRRLEGALHDPLPASDLPEA